MDTFAFIIHPIDPRRDIGRKFPLLGLIANDWTVFHIAPFFPPVLLSRVEGIISAETGKQISGWLIACPLAPRHFRELPEEKVYRKVIQTGRLAEKLGAKIIGLGAFTSVVGDAGKTIAQALEVPVTTGNAYTVSIAVQAIRQAARLMEIPLDSAAAAIVGASGAIGQACALLLAREVGVLYLVGRRQEGLERLRDRILEQVNPASLVVTTRMDVLREAQLVITVTSSIHDVIEPEHLLPGSVVCDVAQPRDVSSRVAAMRDDVLVIDGGMVAVPGRVDFHFDFGLPPGNAYACMAETMALALEGRFQDYTLGKEISLAQVEEITSIAERHGFRLSGFRSFESPITEEHVERVRRNARRVQPHYSVPGRQTWENPDF